MSEEEFDEDLDLSLEDLDGKGKKSSKLTLIIILVAVLGVGGGGAGYFFMTGSGKPNAVTASKSTKPTIKTTAAAAPTKAKPVYLNLEPSFVVNLSDSQGKSHYLEIDIAVMTRDETMIEQIKLHQPLIKNDLLALFSSKTYQELRDNNTKIELRKQALETVQDVMKKQTGKKGVDSVLFTGFVLE